MLQFHATAVEVFTEEEGVLTIHFDDEAEHYLQIQAPETDDPPEDDPEEFEEGYGSVYVEVDDQINSGYNCFSRAELTRNRFRIFFAREPRLTERGGVEATFEVDDDAFAELQRALTHAFRHFDGFHMAADA